MVVKPFISCSRSKKETEKTGPSSLYNLLGALDKDFKRVRAIKARKNTLNKEIKCNASK
jgi:hypothetical protein